MRISAAALLVAGLLGHRMLLNFNIPVLALTSGLVLFLTALQAVLQQFDPPSPVQSEAPKPGLTLAINPLAFPTIVIPYGIAAMIIFVTLAENDPAATATLAGLVVLILFLDWLAMPYAHTILKYAGTALQFFRRGAGRDAGGAGADDYPAKPEPHRGVHAAGSEHDGFRFAHARVPPLQCARGRHRSMRRTSCSRPSAKWCLVTAPRCANTAR